MTVRYPRHILGLDPGTIALGWCLIEVPRPQSWKALGFGTLRAPEAAPLHKRLGQIQSELGAVLERGKEFYAECVVEQPFVNENHMATLAIAGVRGLALAAIGISGLRFEEYLPNKWKLITGRGNASPQQYAYVVQQLLGLREAMPPDAAAAGGLAIYHSTR